MGGSLVNLDDRRWTDLVQQGMDILPFFAPNWTDYNLSDPGITLIELLAWITEIDVYRFNRIPASHILKFLKLVGSIPDPPMPAEMVVQVSLSASAGAMTIPATCELAADKKPTFRTEMDVTISAASLVSVGVDDGEKLLDMTPASSKGRPIGALGNNPKPGAAIYFGFDKQLPAGQPLALYLAFTHGDTACRNAIVAERLSQLQACPLTTPNPCACSQRAQATVNPNALVHPSVVNVWEYFDGSRWRSIAGVPLDDRTRSLTLSGNVILTLATPSQPVSIAMDMPKLHYLRCRFVGGCYDAAPQLTAAVFNAVPAIQLQPGLATLTILATATINGLVPPSGSMFYATFTLNPSGSIIELNFVTSGPSFRLLDYVAPASGADGSITFEAIYLGTSTGLPDQTFSLASPVAMNPAPTLLTLFEGKWTTYQLAPDLDSAGWSDKIAAMDWNSNSITFGDGVLGVVPARGSLILLVASLTRGACGNVPVNTVFQIDKESPHNKSLPNWGGICNAIGGSTITNPIAARGGADAMLIGMAEEKAMKAQSATWRAVTLDDFKSLAQQTPGFQIARVEALAGVDPLLPCGTAAGIISLVVIPYLPLNRPSPDRALMQAVSNHLQSRRMPGTAIRVLGPCYVKVNVRAVVTASGPARAVKKAVAESVAAFLHPLSGGRPKMGWPLGQDIFAADILSDVAGTPNVRHVILLELFDAHGCKQDISIPLGKFGLPELGSVEVEVRPA